MPFLQSPLPINALYKTLYIVSMSLLGLSCYLISYKTIFKIMHKNQELLIKARVTGVPTKQANNKTQLIAEQMLKIHKFGQIQKYIFILTRQQMLLVYFSIIWIVFPVMYFFQLLFPSDQDIEAFMIIWKFLSIAIKLSFIGICIDSYIEISHPLSSFITREQFSNESRRYYLGYIFHEIYTPLLAISEGIQYLQNIRLSKQEEKGLREAELNKEESISLKNETYYMMNDATCSIGETLNDAMTLLKIEEGQMRLVTNAFTIPEIFAILQKRFASMLFEKSMRMQIEIPSDLQHTIFVGDNIRLIHVLSNIVLNAVQYSYDNSIILLVAKAESDPYLPTISARENNRKDRYAKHDYFQDSNSQNQSHQGAIRLPAYSFFHRLYTSAARIPSITSLMDIIQFFLYYVYMCAMSLFVVSMVKFL
jgi:signal transduction histidine kinase